MKKLYIGLTAMLLSAVLFSCKKNGIQVIDQPINLTDYAQIKYFNFAVGLTVPSVNFYANDAKVTGTVSLTGAESTTGTATGGVYPASGYTALPGGNYVFKAQIPTTATTDANLAIATTPSTALANNKFYSLYTSGIYNTGTKMAEAFVIEDVLPAYDPNVANIRLVNTISNAPQAFDFYVKNTTIPGSTEVKIASAVAYKSGSAFVTVPVGNYELYVRYPSSATTNVISRTGSTVVSLNGGKVYTLATRGDIAVSATGTAANRPQIDFTANR
jgi:hypothetical protein